MTFYVTLSASAMSWRWVRGVFFGAIQLNMIYIYGTICLLKVKEGRVRMGGTIIVRQRDSYESYC